jgi:hypothetical protein
LDLNEEFAIYFSIFPDDVSNFFHAKLPVSHRMQNAALIGMFILMFVFTIFSSKIGFLSAIDAVIALFLFFRTINTSKRFANQIRTMTKCQSQSIV